MFNLFTKKKVKPMHVMPGDTIQMRYRGLDGREETVEHNIEKTASYDTLAVGEIKDELGFSEGLVGIVGNEKDA